MLDKKGLTITSHLAPNTWHLQRMSRIALTRAVSASLARCELTYLDRAPIDLERARRQHAAYEALLTSLEWEIVRLPTQRVLLLQHGQQKFSQQLFQPTVPNRLSASECGS